MIILFTILISIHYVYIIDGGKVAVGNICGIVDIYDISLRRILHKKIYEITHVSSSQVTVRNIHTNLLTSIRSIYNNEIIKTTVHNDRFVLCTTAETLILCDSITNKTSEIKWSNNNNNNTNNNNTNNNKYTNNNTNNTNNNNNTYTNNKEKFIFDNTNVCIIYNPSQGEVSIVEYGENDVLAYFRTSYVNKHVFSLKCVGGDYDSNTTNNTITTTTNHNNSMSNSPSPIRRNAASATTSNTPSIKKVVAYLIDLQTICIKDLVTSSANTTLTLTHDMKIDWLSLNDKATLLLYRDRGQGLHLYRIHTQVRTQLITLCSYVQWVPQSDVVVGQQQQQLCVWYNLNAPDQVTMREIRGVLLYM